MARVFVVASDAGPSGAGQALADAIRAMPPGRHTLAGIDLDGGSPLGFPRLTHRLLDPRRWQALRNAIRAFDPGVVHAVGRKALHAVHALGVRHPLAYSGHTGGPLSAVEFRAFTRPSLAIVHNHADAARLGTLCTVHVFYGVEATTPPDSGEPGRRNLRFGGSLDAASDPLQAAWAFDVLKYAATDLELVFPDVGPMREAVERLAYSLGFDDYRVRFAAGDELARVQSRRPLVWLTQPAGGALAALKAVAAGHAVLAMRTPELAEYCGTMPGVTLVPAGDRVALASATLKALDRPEPPASAAFPLAAMVDGFAAAYDTLATDAG